MGGPDKEDTAGDDSTGSEEVTEEQLAALVEDAEQEPADEKPDKEVAEEVTAPPALSEEQVEDVVRRTLQHTKRATPEQAPAEGGTDDDADMPVTRGELAAHQRQTAANQQAMQLQAELRAAEAQFAGDHDSEEKEDFYVSAIRRLQANPNQTAADAYQATVKRHAKAVDRGVRRRIDSAAQKKAARGEPMGPGSSALTKGAELPDIDYDDNEAVSKLGKQIIRDMQEE
jgi:hypothetical protein